MAMDDGERPRQELGDALPERIQIFMREGFGLVWNAHGASSCVTLVGRSPPPPWPRPTSHMMRPIPFPATPAAMRLREEFHIGGVCIGTLPNHTTQSIQLGLPVILLPEEVALLDSLGPLSSRPIT